MLLSIKLENGSTVTSVTRKQAEEMGLPEATISQAEGILRLSAIKAECRRRIYAEASAETQINMATAVAVASSKAASERSDEEKAVAVGLGEAHTWVEAMQARVKDLAADPDLDFRADESWSDLPDGVRAVVAMF